MELLQCSMFNAELNPHKILKSPKYLIHRCQCQIMDCALFDKDQYIMQCKTINVCIACSPYAFLPWTASH